MNNERYVNTNIFLPTHPTRVASHLPRLLITQFLFSTTIGEEIAIHTRPPFLMMLDDDRPMRDDRSMHFLLAKGSRVKRRSCSQTRAVAGRTLLFACRKRVADVSETPYICSFRRIRKEGSDVTHFKFYAIPSVRQLLLVARRMHLCGT